MKTRTSFALLISLAPFLLFPPAASAALQSPKASAAPKVTPMRRDFTPAAYLGAHLFPPDIKWNLNFFGCDTNNPACVLYDEEHLSAAQLAGAGLRLEFAAQVDASSWVTFALFYPPPQDMVAEAAWFYSNDQRPAARFWRVTPYVPEGFTPAALGAWPRAPWVNPAFPTARAWVRPK